MKSFSRRFVAFVLCVALICNPLAAKIARAEDSLLGIIGDMVIEEIEDAIIEAAVDAFVDWLTSDSSSSSSSSSSGASSSSGSENFQDAYFQAEKYLKERNYSQAFEIFNRLSNQGYAPAQDKLGWMYQNAWGVTRDYSQAMRWFKTAAEQGNSAAQASVGLLYYKGWGVSRDYDEALRWYKKAAAQGYEIAKKRCDMIERLKTERPYMTNLEAQNSLPYPGVIFDNNVYIRAIPNLRAPALKKLNSGHPVSIYRTSNSDHEFWYYVKTASGTEGWALASYVVALDKNKFSRTEIERSNRNHKFPSEGKISVSQSDKLNIRNFPVAKGSQVLDALPDGSEITAHEIFSDSNSDWYRVTTHDGTKGWVNGKYIRLHH